VKFQAGWPHWILSRPGKDPELPQYFRGRRTRQPVLSDLLGWSIVVSLLIQLGILLLAAPQEGEARQVLYVLDRGGTIGNFTYPIKSFSLDGELQQTFPLPDFTDSAGYSGLATDVLTA
jgi:hypothetical protein